jgi:hypothetical protein
MGAGTALESPPGPCAPGPSLSRSQPRRAPPLASGFS